MPASLPKIPRCVFPDFPVEGFSVGTKGMQPLSMCWLRQARGQAFAPCTSVSPVVKGFVWSMLIYDIFLSSVAGDGVAVDALKRLDESIRNSTLRTECDRGAEALPTLREALPAGLRADSLLNSRSVIQQPRARSAAVNSPMLGR